MEPNQVDLLMSLVEIAREQRSDVYAIRVLLGMILGVLSAHVILRGISR